MTSDAQPAEDTTVPAYRPREYQLEMLEASLRENIIVAVCSLYLPVLTGILTSVSQMGTGSGKTPMYVCLSATAYLQYH